MKERSRKKELQIEAKREGSKLYIKRKTVLAVSETNTVPTSSAATLLAQYPYSTSLTFAVSFFDL
jgi:hypothetical protein